MNVFKTQRTILFKAKSFPKQPIIKKPLIPELKKNTNIQSQKKNLFLGKKKNKFIIEKCEEKNMNKGHWSFNEHLIFLQALDKYGTNLKKIYSLIPTRTSIQVRTHANKFLKRLKTYKDDTLGIDLTSNSLNNIKDIINYIKSVNNNYSIFNLFLLMSRDYSGKKNMGKLKVKNNLQNKILDDDINISKVFNNFEGNNLIESNDDINNNINSINNSLSNDNLVNNLNIIYNYNFMDILTYNYICNIFFINAINNMNKNIVCNYLDNLNNQYINSNLIKYTNNHDLESDAAENNNNNSTNNE